MQSEYKSFISGESVEDIIPKINQLIYRDKPRPPPIFNKQYNVIGFDADHCVVKYNVPALIQHISKVQGRYMIQNFGYPEEYVDISDQELNFPMNCAVLDKKNGIVMKLGENNEILRACYGFRRLNDEEIVQQYGAERKLQKYDPIAYKNIDYNVFMGYFESGLQVLFAKAVQLKKSGKINYTYPQIWQHMRMCMNNNWGVVDYQKKVAHSLKDYGLFFPSIVANPQKYIRPSPQYRELVKQLRNRGIKTFLATNSHYEYTQVIMSTSFGPDWKEHFDVICINALKPSFFGHQKNTFNLANVDAAMYQGPSVDTLEKGKEYLQGNKQFGGKNDLKYLFVGDNYSTDCRAASLNNNWDGLAIVQEIQDVTQLTQIQPLPKYQSVWGDYFYEMTSKGQLVRTLWMKYLQQNTRYAVPLISWMKHLIKE